MTRDEILLANLDRPERLLRQSRCIKGHRIWVTLILDFLASGWTHADISEDYPAWRRHIRACIAYARGDVAGTVVEI